MAPTHRPLIVWMGTIINIKYLKEPINHQCVINTVIVKLLNVNISINAYQNNNE